MIKCLLEIFIKILHKIEPDELDISGFGHKII